MSLFTNSSNVTASKLKKLPGNSLEEVLIVGNLYHYSAKDGVIKQDMDTIQSTLDVSPSALWVYFFRMALFRMALTLTA